MDRKGREIVARGTRRRESWAKEGRRGRVWLECNTLEEQ